MLSFCFLSAVSYTQPHFSTTSGKLTGLQPQHYTTNMENNTVNNIPTTIEDLAIMIQRTMASKEDLTYMATKEDLKAFATKEDMNEFRVEVNTHFDHLDARVGRIEADIHELRGEIVYRHEFEDVLGRVKYLEKKLGIESGV